MKCIICEETRESGQVMMCRACCRSYDRFAHQEGSVMEALAWAARRARRSERARSAKALR